jgi:hypothetical protein
VRKSLWVIAVIGSVMSLAGGAARADVMLSGPDGNDGSYSTAALAGLANVSDTVGYGGLTGISLWGLLGGADASSPTAPIYGAITTSTPPGDNGKNAILRYYLVAAGGNGAQSVVSLGEIDPSFGGTAPVSAFVAFAGAGNALLAAPQLVVPGMTARDVSNLASLRLLAAPALPAASGGVSSIIALSGQVSRPGSYSLKDLQSDFAPVQETVSGDAYTGVPLWTFLDAGGDVIDGIVTTAGTDGYEVVLALAELDPALGGNPGDFLPYADTGGDFPDDSVARTILPGDNKHGRWLSNLDSIDVAAVPEPGSLPLMASALTLLGLLVHRKGRRALHTP